MLKLLGRSEQEIDIVAIAWVEERAASLSHQQISQIVRVLESRLGRDWESEKAVCRRLSISDDTFRRRQCRWEKMGRQNPENIHRGPKGRLILLRMTPDHEKFIAPNGARRKDSIISDTLLPPQEKARTKKILSIADTSKQIEDALAAAMRIRTGQMVALAETANKLELALSGAISKTLNESAPNVRKRKKRAGKLRSKPKSRKKAA